MKMTIGKFIDLLNYLGIPLLLIYVLSMVVYPGIEGGTWAHVHSVWHSWQTLNVGVLAFLSSLIAFNISKYNAEEQRKRELIASTSFLPQALSGLSQHLNGCAHILSQAWEKTRNEESFKAGSFEGLDGGWDQAAEKSIYECIRHADTPLANNLASILSKLQISDARIMGLSSTKGLSANWNVRRPTIESYLYGVAELQALINLVFPYSRGMQEFSAVSVGIEQLNNAYMCLDLKSEIIDGIQEYTKRNVAK